MGPSDRLDRGRAFLATVEINRVDRGHSFSLGVERQLRSTRKQQRQVMLVQPSMGRRHDQRGFRRIADRLHRQTGLAIC